jgi:hypothetical protein
MYGFQFNVLNPPRKFIFLHLFHSFQSNLTFDCPSFFSTSKTLKKEMSGFRKRNVRGKQQPSRLSVVAGDDDDDREEEEETLLTQSIPSRSGKPFRKATSGSFIPKHSLRPSLAGSTKQSKEKGRLKRPIGASTKAVSRSFPSPTDPLSLPLCLSVHISLILIAVVVI